MSARRPNMWRKLIFGLLVNSLVVATFSGCNKSSTHNANDWSTPTKITESIEGLGSGVALIQKGDALMALQILPNYRLKLLILSSGGASWFEEQLADLPTSSGLYPYSDKIALRRGYIENEQVVIITKLVALSKDAKPQLKAENKWETSKESIFGTMLQNIRLNAFLLHPGVENGQEFAVPYSIRADTVSGRNVNHGPYNNGVFRSFDMGISWQLEPISTSESYSSTVCRTVGFDYYIASGLGTGNGYDVSWSRKPLSPGSTWTRPAIVTKTLGKAAGRWEAAAANDLIHLCWMDCRREKMRLDLQAPYRENYEIAYSQVADSQGTWSKDVILSKGLFYSFTPVISTEGGKVVVVWAGTPKAHSAHTSYDPNDIYCVTSGDRGKTWSTPTKITDVAKDGFTAGVPQVLLVNGVIHLMYVQGKLNLKQEMLGLTKLNQPPWPVYYQQRPFPN